MFVALGVWFAVSGALPFDRRVLEASYDVTGRHLDEPMRIAAYTGSAWVLAPIAIGLACLFAAQRRWPALALLAGASAVVWLVNPALKRAFARERPHVRPIVEPLSTYAFPSGHAIASMTFAALIVVVAWPTRWRRAVVSAATLYVLLVGATRIVLGVHYPSDVLAGWALGLAAVTGLAALLTWDPRPDRRRRAGEQTRSRADPP